MENQLDIQKQQRLLLRGISNIQHQLKKAFDSGLKQDFLEAENLNREFKRFVETRVTAAEIRSFMQEIPVIQVESAEPGLFKIMTSMSIFSMFSGSSLRADENILQAAHAVKGKYGTLEFMARMMDGD